MQYIYPDNLKSKPTLFLWELKDLAIIGIMAIISVFAIAQTGIFIPLVITCVFAFLTIQFEGVSILKFIKSAFSFFIVKRQYFDWNKTKN